MSDVHSAADGIKETVLEWTDANDLDTTLEDFHELPRALEDAMHDYAQRLRENTNLSDHIPEAIEEAASQMAGIADHLKEAIQYGVQQN